jgi:hypothetical protein
MVRNVRQGKAHTSRNGNPAQNSEAFAGGELTEVRMTPARRSIKLITRRQRDGLFRLRHLAVVTMAFVFSGLAPAVLMALIWHETSLSLVVFTFTFLFASIYSIAAGLPLFVICQLRGWINLVSCVVLGACIGILPSAMAYPTDYSKSLIYFGLLGAWGGFVFWAVLKSWAIFDGGQENLPNNSPKAQGSTATPPLCIASKPAASRLTGVLSAALPSHSRRTRPVAYPDALGRQGVASNE